MDVMVVPNRLLCLNTWLTGVALLGGVALLQLLWHCWGNCISVHFLLPSDQDVELSAFFHYKVCLNAALFPAILIIESEQQAMSN